MLTLESDIEQRIRQGANESGLTIQNFLNRLLECYASDKHDIEQADLVMSEVGGISLEELKIKYDL
jgi:acyl-CoA synthetase (NDP forming)